MNIEQTRLHISQVFPNAKVKAGDYSRSKINTCNLNNYKHIPVK